MSDFATLVVGAKADKSTVNSAVNEIVSAMKTAATKAKDIEITPSMEKFQSNMKKITEQIEKNFKNVNLSGIESQLKTTISDSGDIQEWVYESEKVLNTLKMLKQIQLELGSKGKSLDLFNPSQINQLLNFANNKNLIGLQEQIAASKDAAEQQRKQISKPYYYSSKADIEQAVLSRKILAGQQDIWKNPAREFGILDTEQLKSASAQYDLSLYTKTAEMIRQIIKEKQELGEIKTEEDAAKNLELSTQLYTSYQQLLSQEKNLRKLFTVTDENGNEKELLDPKKLLSADLTNAFQNIDFSTVLADAGKKYMDAVRASVEASYKNVREQLFDKVDQMIGKSMERTEKTGEKARGEINKKREKNAGGTGGSGEGEGSGTGGGSGTGSGSGGGSAGQYNQELDQLNRELEEAEAKLKQLKKGVDIDELIGGEGGEKVLRGYIDELEELARTIDGMDQSKISNKMKTQFAQIYDIINRNNHGSDLSDLVEDVMYGKIDPDGELDYDSIFKYVDKQAIEQQEQIISRLKQRISDVKNTPPTTIGDGVNTVDNGDSVTVKVKPDTSSFIADLKSQVEGETIEIKVAPESGSGDNFKQIIDEIPDTKEIKLSIIDYDKIPLMNDAAGNLVDVFRGTHGVFGINGKNGVSWFTDELEMATQYADELSEDGKIIKANLAFKNPLEIFGEGADYDKINISGLSDRIKNIANDLGFDVNKMLTDDIVTVAKHAGYDGVIFRDIKDGYDDLAHNVFAVVDSIQVKNEELYNSVKAKTGELSDIETSPNQSETMRIQYDNIKNGISDVLSTPFDAVINAETSQIRPDIESVLSAPFEIQIEPSDSLKATISSMLDGENFKVNLGVDNVTKATDPSIGSPISSGNVPQDAGSVPQEERNIQERADGAAQAVDNLGRKIDETFAKKVSGTVLIDDMQRIITLFHHSDKEFDSFDLRKSADNTRLGRGAYFGFDQTNMADFPGQDIMSQWYANVQSIFDTTNGNETQLDSSQIENFIKTYLSSESEEYISNFRQSLQKGGLEAIRAIKAEAKKSTDVEMFKNMMGSLGYDAILGETSGNYGGIQQTLKELNVLDPSKIFKIDSSQFSELERINDEIEITKEFIQSYKQDIEDFKAAAQDMSKSPEDRAYFQEMVDNGFKDENEQIRIYEERLQQLLESKQKLADAIITQAKSSNETQVASDGATKFFRGVDLRGRGSIGEAGIYDSRASLTPWYSSSLDVAKEYAGVLGEIYSLELDTNKIMTVDAQGAHWGDILYLGQGEEEESKKLLQLYENLSQAKKKLQEDFGWDEQDTSLLNIMKSSAEAQRAVMEYQRLQMDFKNGINASDKYGYTSTDDLAQMAKEMGYQAIVIKNVMDSESGIIADNMSLLTGSMDGVKNASLQDLSGNVIETYNQEADAARNDADAQRELAAAKKEAGSQTSNGNPISLGNDETSDIGLTYDQLLQKIQLENQEIEKGNRAFKERLVLFDEQNKVIASHWGDDKQVQAFTEEEIGDPNGKKLFHTHQNRGMFSLSDFESFNKMGLNEETLHFKDSFLKFNVENLSDDMRNAFYDIIEQIQKQILFQYSSDGLKIDSDKIDIASTMSREIFTRIGKMFGAEIETSGDFANQLSSSLSDFEHKIISKIISDLSSSGFDQYKVADIVKDAFNMDPNQLDIGSSSVDQLIERFKVLRDNTHKTFDQTIELYDIYTKLGGSDIAPFEAEKLDFVTDDDLMELKKSNETPVSTDGTSSTEQQSESNRELAQTARDAAQAEKELGDATSEANTQQQNTNKVDVNIEGIDNATKSLEKLKQMLSDMGMSIQEFNAKLASIGEGADFSFIDKLSGSAEELKNLVQILSHSQTEIDGVINNAGTSNQPGAKSLAERVRELGFSDQNYNDIIEAINNPGKILSINWGGDTEGETDELYNKLLKLKELLQEFKYEWKASENTDTFNMSGMVKSTDDLQKALDNYKELQDRAQEYYTLQKQVDERGYGSLSDSQRKSYNELANMYKEAEAAAQKYNGTIKELTESQENFKNTLKEVGEYQQKQDAEAKKRIQDTEIQRTDNRLSKIKPADQSRWAEQYETLKSAIESANDAFRDTGDVNAYRQAVDEAFQTFQQFSKMPSGVLQGQKATGLEDAKSYFENLVSGYKTVLKGVSGDTAFDSNGIAKWSAEVRDAEGNVSRLTLAVNQLDGSMVLATKQLPQQMVGISGMIDGVKSRLKDLATYWTARFFDPMDIMRYAKQVFDIIRQYDDAFTEMRKVSDESVDSLKNFQVESFSKANDVGTTALQFQQSTADWLRLGESFEEAQKSAATSNVLLNVSEFSNIEEATQALTSASQAYKELEKMDIVDKLNNIGNNFSVSTDKLASGLQNAAAVLKTQGNDLDQSLALLTAGNAITQDMSKTSAGIRTIALRISGTEEAKNEIKDMGEDIDDFVVRTKSKTDQIIRDYTAVASNAYKGVSVLDENGNLRDTYDILLDIAKVYEEIQAEDKQHGTNRAQALVETLAGKNRSNIAASILSNPQMLQDVYEASQNSQGSAQEELEKHLDSISGKTQKLTNELHELANITINSDGLKTMLDIVNSLLSGVNSLAKTFGSLNTIIGTVIGGVLSKKGFGLFNFDKSTNTWNNGFKNISKALKNNYISSVIDPVKEAFKGMGKDTSLQDAMINIINNGEDIVPQGFKKFYNELPDKTISLTEGMQQYRQQILSTANSFSVLKNMGQTALATIGNIVASTFSVIAVETFFKIISAGFNQLLDNTVRKNEIAIQKGTTAEEEIDKLNQEYEDKVAQTKTLQDRYNELRKGVTVSDTGIKNISLSDDEYNEFLDINQELVSIFPTLRGGVDEYGNSIANLGSKASETASMLKEQLDVMQKMHAQDIKEQMPDVIGKVRAENNELDKQIGEYQTSYDSVMTFFKDISDGDLRVFTERNDTLEDALNIALKDTGASFKFNEATKGGFGRKSTKANYQIVGLPNAQKKAVEKLKEYYSEDLPLLGDELIGDISTAQQQKKSNWVSQFVPNMIDTLEGKDYYNDFSDTIRSGINTALYNLDWEKFDDVDENSLQRYVDNKIVFPFSRAIQYSKNKKATEKAINQLFTYDYDFLNNQDMKSAVDNILKEVFPHDEGIREVIKVALNYVDEDGDEWTADKARDDLYEKLGGVIDKTDDGKKIYKQGKAGISYGLLTNLNQSQQSALNYALDEMNVNPKTIDGWDRLLSVISEAKSRMSNVNVVKSGTFGELINNEDYQQDAEKYEKSLSSLTSALETMRTEGKLSSEAQKDLIEQFPDLAKEAEKTGGQITESMVQDEATDKLSAWVKTIREAMKEMSPKEQSGAKEYIEDLITSYGKLADSIKDARDLYLDVNVGEDTGVASHEQRKAMEKQFDEQVATLQESLGDEELDMDVVYTLVAMDMFSGTAEEIKANYDDVKLRWDIKIGNAEELKRIQKDLEVEDAKRNLTKAKQSKKQTAGKDLTERDYVEIGNSLANTTELKKDAEKIAQENYDVAYDAYIDASKKAAASEETISGFKKKGGIPTSALQAMQDAEADRLTEAHNSVKTSEKELYDAQAQTISAEEEQLQNRIDQYQSESKTLQNAYTELEDGANQIQNRLKKREKLGMDYTKGQYAELINNAQDQMKNIGLQIDAKKAELTKYDNDTDIGVDSKIYRDTEAAITELEGKQIDLKQQTQEWQTMISTGIELNQTKRDLEDLQTVSTDIQDAISFRETRGLKATVKDYQKLMKNSAEQIKNIKTQNDLLRQQQAELITNNGVAAMQSSTYRDIQAQIESNNQSLRGLAQNQYDWGKQMATGQIQNIMDSMSAAQQAMSTGHLADTDTLKNLISMNRDYASALVTTTTGTYVDAQAMAKLAEDQGDLTIAMIDAQKAAEMMNYESNVDQMMSMAQQIDPTITSIQQLNQALAEHPDSPEWSKIFDLSEANFNIQSNLDQLQAMKEQVLASQSYLGQYQMAQSSWNFSDPMQQIRGGLEGAKQLYDQGWWGKDDFTSFAKMIATNEQLQQETFVDNFMDNYQKAQKYLTEDRTGVENWISKMREEGYVDEKGDFDIKSMEKFANDMGFNTEFSEYMLMAMKDAGYEVDISRLGDKYAESYKQITGTEANAGLQMQDLLSQMRESARAGEDIRTSAEQAGAALQRMKEAGMSDDAISKLVEQYNELGDMTGFHIDPQTLEVTTTVDKSELEETEEEINQPKDMMVQIKEEYDISDEDITKTNNAIQRTFEGNKANLDQELSTSGLSDYSAEDLLKIDFEDGQYLPDTAEAESALENLAVKIGLVGSKSEVTNDVAQALVATLLELNSIQSETEQNMGETGQTPSQVVGADKTLSYEAAARQYDSTPWYKKVATEASQTVSSASSSGKSFIESGASAIQSGLDTITQPLRVKQQIETVLENGTTLNELKQMTDDQLISVGFEAEGLDEVKSQVDELIQTDGADMVIKINEEQFDTLGTTISDSVKNAFTNVDSTEATTAMEEITTSYEELETAMSGDPLKINIDTSDAVSSLDELKQAMEKLGLSYNSGNAEGEENATAPAESFETAHREIQSMRQKPQINNASQSSESVDSTGDNVEQVQVPATAVVDEVDDSNVQDEEIDMDAKVELEADTSSLDTVEAEAETPIEKKVELSVSPSANPLLEGGMTGAGTIEQTTIQKTVEEHEQHNIIKNEVQGDASDATEASSEAESAIDSVPTEHTTDINANDNASTPANNAKNAIESVPTSRSATITATISGLESVTSLKDAIDKLQDKEITIKATTVNVDGTTSSSTSVTKPSSANTTGKTTSKITKLYNGTAHATGTALFDSPAHAKGTNWAIEDDETALVNELGTEGLVRDGRFYQIPGGAQYINLKRGDIIFNHKQVEELNKHGHVISGGGHGKAYANGTLSSIPAHDSIAKGNVNNNVWKGSGSGDSGGGGGGGSYVAATNDNTNALTQNTTSTNNNTGSTTQAAKNVETNLDKFKKWADSLFDWIEVRMERLQHSIDMNTAQSELNNTYQKKNSEINKAMKTTRQMISDQEIGADKYEKQAAKVASKAVSMGALSQGKVNELVKRIQKGELDIMEYKARKKPQQSSSSKSSSSSSSNSQSEEETPELTFIEEYKEWWDKSEQMRLSILENKQALKDLAQTKLDNIIEQYDTIVGLSEQIQSKADAQKENYLTYGKGMRSKSVEKTVDTRVDQQKRITKARQEEEKAYQKELKSALKEFGENSNQYREALARLEEVRTSRIESQTAERQIQVDYQEERLQSIQDKWEQLAGYAAAVQSSSESLANLLETQGTDVRKSTYEKEIKAQRKQQNEQTKAYKNEMKYYEEEMKRAKKLYGESNKMYIDAKTNFEEMKKNHRDSMQQYIEIEKNYQQKRLDYLKEKWDSFINLAEARQATAKSKEGLYNAQGRPLNGTQIKDAYIDQRYQQDQVTKYYQKLQKDLQAEEKRMRKVYGKDSNEYRAWQAELEAATKGLNDSKTASLDLRKAFMELDAQVMNFDITRLKQSVESMANSVALREKRGTRVGETGNGINDSDYTGQISANQKQIALYRQLAEYYRLQQTGLDKNSKQYMEYEEKIYGAKNAIDSLNMSNEELKESARNNRWKSFYKLSDQLDLMVSDYTHLIGLMNEESFFDDNGNGYQLTMNGLSAIALYGDQMEANRQKVALYQEGLRALREELKNNMISEEKYIEEQKKLLGGVQEATTAIHSEKEAIIALTKTQLTNEANMLKKIIQNRKDALSAKKEYYDYDKNISDKNKDIQSLEQRIRALQGMTDESSRAQLARLQAELADAQEDRDDTIREHAYDSQMNAYDKMTENIDESLDNNLRAMEANSEIQDRVVNEMLQKVLYNYNTAYNNINDTIFSSGTVMASTANAQVNTTNDMLNTIRTSYQDVYNNINGLIGDTGTRVSSQTQTILGDMKATIQHAMEDSQKAIDDWKKKNSELGTDVKTTFIASGNERTSENLAKTAADEAAAKSTAKVTYDKNMAATAKKLVDELPSNIKLANKDQVNEAKKYYDQLTADQKKYVDWDKLKAALDKITKLEEEKKKAEEAKAKAEADAKAKAKAKSEARVSTAKKALNADKEFKFNAEVNKAENAMWDAFEVYKGYNIDAQAIKETSGAKSSQYKEAVDAKNTAWAKYQNAKENYAIARDVQARELEALDSEFRMSVAYAGIYKSKYGENSEQYKKALEIQNNAQDRYNRAKDPKAYGEKAIKSIISQGTKRSSKKLTDAEKKSHGDLWEYIASKYGYNINNGVISELAQSFGVKLANASKPTTAEMNKILKLMKEAGYARGTLSTRKDELNWTHEGEIIRRSDGAILRQLPQGTQVVPKLASENLMRWAQINPSQLMGEMQKVADIPKSNQQQVINPILNYSPTINGSGLNQDQLAAILKKERDDAFRDFQNRLRKDLRMSGR